jgi:hypothetical protein
MQSARLCLKASACTAFGLLDGALSERTSDIQVDDSEEQFFATDWSVLERAQI